MDTTHQLISQMDISALNFSPEFISICQHLGFKNIEALMEYKFSELAKLKGFDERMLQEYVEFMGSIGMGRLVRP